MKHLCNLNGLKSLICATCSKNLNKPSCIDLILTNKPNFFQHSTVFESDFFDFHFLAVTELKN